MKLDSIVWPIDFQIPFTTSAVVATKSGWLDILAISAYIAGASAIALVIQSAAAYTRRGAIGSNLRHSRPDDPSTPQNITSFDRIGGRTIFAFRLVQLLETFALLGISVTQLISEHANANATPHSDSDADMHIGYIVQCALFSYLSILGALAIFGDARLSSRAYAHNSWILALVWCTYMYRDVWPLATTDEVPKDAAEAPFLRVKLVLLSTSAVIIPLFAPRKYTPIDPKEVIEPSPEQTASLASLLTYAFMEPVVRLAYRIPHLSYKSLPPLSDYDYLKNLVGRCFTLLDPMKNKSQQHLALKLMRVFWVDLFQLVVMSVAAVVTMFSGPLSLNRLLTHLESGGVDDAIKPWFWIVVLFFGRALKSVADQWFNFVHTRISIRIQAVITELVFEHALRIRMKAETSNTVETSQSVDSTVVATPDTASQTIGEGDEEGESSDGDSGDANTRTTASSSSNTKDKGKISSHSASKRKVQATSTPARQEHTKKGGNKNLVGRLNNLVSSDLSSLQNVSMNFVITFFESPFQIILCMVFLYQVLGWSAWVGLATMIILLPVPGYITKRIQGTQREKMKRTDARVQLVTEMMNVIRMVKLFGWEPRISKQVDEQREKELVFVRRSRILGFSNILCNSFIPTLVAQSTFFTYTVIMKETLTASKVYSAMIVFDMLRMDMSSAFYMLPSLIQANVALERIQDFLQNTELIDEFTEPQEDGAAQIQTNTVPEEYRDTIGIRQASFTWANEPVVSETPGGTRKRTFVLNIEDEVIFRRGKINLIIGPTGAGKTSLLMALLGEMHYRPAGPDSFVSLPRARGVAYAAQESWVQNDTIKNNIVFGAPFDEVRYNKVIDQCALKRDLSLFDAGDDTEVGERGITLSGGQKARVTLARAVYSDADILLMDDILAALDVHTSRWIVDKCFKGDLLRDRTIIIVTHNVAMVSPIADLVIDIGSDGRILNQGSFSKILAHDATLLEDFREEQTEIAQAEREMDAESISEDAAIEQNAGAGKLVVEEELEAGHVGRKALLLYFGNMSRQPIFFWLVFICGHLVRQSITTTQSWYLGHWAAQYEIHRAHEVNVGHYLTVWTLMVLAGMLASAFCVIYYVGGSVMSGRIIHQRLLASILGSTLRWLDKTPTARIIARCTEDIQTLDARVARSIEILIESVAFMTLRLLSVVTFTPIFIIPAIVCALLGALLGEIFMKAQMSVKREMSNVKAPVLSHFGAAVSGITSVRAYGAQKAFISEAYTRIDKYTRIAITHENLNRWITMRIEFIGTVFTTGLVIYLIYVSPLSASNTGFSFGMAFSFSRNILQIVRQYNDFEVASNSLERIQQYLDIEHESEATPEGVPPAYWPASGSLEVENLSARYSSDGPEVLHDISFEVASGQRIGIVGRTGSGKSSLTLSLLRCILTEGNIRYDGLQIDKINLDALRSSITIIPQVPEMLSGTLRQNLDPFSEHDDAVLNDALRSAGLFNIQAENEQSRITLDTEIAGGGANLSFGQRQVLALARAIVRQSKLLILDEATSAIDYETDSIIQRSLRTELPKDVTLLTVAHRLQTIMDADKIMVLDAGRIVEFGKPSKLLQNEEGILRALVDESGDKEKLYEMAFSAAGA